MGFKVMSKLCETCIFSARTPISQERFDELREGWAKNDNVQECHKATINKEHIGCRGHYEAARRGELPHPITGIMATLGIAGKMSDLMQVAERLNFIVFVDVERAQDVED